MNPENNKLNKECDFCKANATCLCFKCNNYFCEKCFKIIHDLKKENHKKEILDTFIPIDLKCHEHPDDRNSLFCIDEKGNYKYIKYRNMLCILLL